MIVCVCKILIELLLAKTCMYYDQYDNNSRKHQNIRLDYYDNKLVKLKAACINSHLSLILIHSQQHTIQVYFDTSKD